jgi:N-acetyl sugar amidotransferase
MNRCNKCAMPDTRPDHVFENGVCPACRVRDLEVDWEEREKRLLELLDRHQGEVIVPSSGGKDSTYQVIRLLELGANPTIVTATTCHLTPIGRRNIDNLSRYATTIEVSPNKTVRAKLNRFGLEWVGDISWPEHAAIFSTPFRVAAEMGIDLIMYGENPQNQYGGPRGTEEAQIMTERWTQEFGGFLGLRTSDFYGVEGIRARDMQDYELPPNLHGIEAHWLGQYERWDSRRNARVAEKAGMEQHKPCPANWWNAENLDNAQTGLHDHMMYRKYAYGRGATQIAVDVREGIVERGAALRWIHEHDGMFPFEYAEVRIDEVLDRIDMAEDQLADILNQYTNWELFEKDDSRPWWPVLKC